MKFASHLGACTLHDMSYSSCNTEAETPNSETGMYTTFREHNISW